MKNSRNNIARLSDNELVWLYSDTRTREYYGELFLRYIPLVYGVALKYTAEREEAKSAVRILYERLAEKLTVETGSVEEFRLWLYGETECYMKSLKGAAAGEDSSAGSQPLSREALECICRLEDGHEAVWKALDGERNKLTKPQKVCLRLFFAKKKSFAEIADSSGYLLDNIKQHLRKGLETLSATLARTSKKKDTV